MEEEKSEDIFGISNQIKEWMDKGITLLEKDKKAEDKTRETDKEIINKSTQLRDLYSKIHRQFLAGLGQMYNGVLIAGKLSIRKYGAYPYRCQSKCDFKEVIGYLKNYQAEVFQNIGLEKGKIIYDLILEFENGALDDNEDFLNVIIPIMPFNIFDFDNKERSYYDKETDFRVLSKGEMMIVSQIGYDRGMLRFQDEDGYSVDNPAIRNLCAEKFCSIIKETKDKMVRDIEEKINGLKGVSQLVEDKLGKYLIAAKLNDVGWDDED